ncbi:MULTISPECIES: FISUMP domain-containing protein [unclassified Fibrobacter]|uniref:FISUMP domain-containing protein n=1 Tax=unclassified Fibrobacter TaxID=2634177 RepID=UPI000D6ACCC6|nr:MULTISPECIES: FISUMP domain-containing protein [unclassified Fibrobacter]PWJ52853.1 uncharacterized protein (TIGR02145 family) [Fibrobacter sp. UWR4]PZW60717.1 uncharacterized protein (TIGR02145 family) [Fibrobacter sp. UWR1]
MKTFKKIGLVSAAAFALFAFNACGDDSNSTSASGENSAQSSAVEDDESSSSINDNSSSSSVILSDSEGSSSSSSAKGGGKSSSSVVSNGNSSEIEVLSSSSSAKRTCTEDSVFSEQDGYEIYKYQCINGKWKCIDVIDVEVPDLHYDMSAQFYYNSREHKNAGEDFIDPRDNQVYKTTYIKRTSSEEIAFRVFAENLNFGTQIKSNEINSDDSKVEKYCYNDDSWYCDNGFGGLYTWSEAMGFHKACDTTFVGTTESCPDMIDTTAEHYSNPELAFNYAQHRGICPEGWHVMNLNEWKVMKEKSDLSLKSNLVWNCSNVCNSTGMSALPVGKVDAGEFKGEFKSPSKFV